MILIERSKKQQHNLVLIVNPRLSSNPEYKSFAKYAEYCLKQFKPVHGNQMDLLDKYANKDAPQDKDWIRSWHIYAASSPSQQSYHLVNHLFDEIKFHQARQNFKPDAIEDLAVENFTFLDRFGEQIDNSDEDRFSSGSDEFKLTDESDEDDDITFSFIDPKKQPNQI